MNLDFGKSRLPYLSLIFTVLNNDVVLLLGADGMLKQCEPYQFLPSQAECSWARGYKTFFMLNSVKHEILNAHKYKNIKNYNFLASDKPRMLFFPLINDKKPTIVGILTFMSRKKFMLS